MDISIITVTWNNKDEIRRQIPSVFAACRDISCELIISDNGSKDGTTDFIKKEFPQIKLIENGENLGFGAANNKGVDIAQGDFVLFLNPDMKLEEGSLDILLDWMEMHPDVGIVSPRLVDQHGKFNEDARPRRFPKLWEMVAMIFKIPHLFPQILDNYFMKDFDPEKEQDVPSVRGSFMLVRRELVDQLGWGFDPRYFIWFEDVDTCRECWKAGYKVVYTPIISAVDYIGQSFKKRTTLWKQKQFTKSMLQYFQKWEPWYKWMWIALFRPVGIALAWVNDKMAK